MLAVALAPPLDAVAQQDPAARAPFVVEQTYWINPGKELQFLGLFEKAQVPLLRAKIKDGSALWARLSKPVFNTANDQCDLRVTVAWRDPDSAMGQPPPSEGAIGPGNAAHGRTHRGAHRRTDLNVVGIPFSPNVGPYAVVLTWTLCIFGFIFV
jgi:hypothetical protein